MKKACKKAAQINIIYSFGERDEEKLSSKLIKAQNLINDATTISKNNCCKPYCTRLGWLMTVQPMA